MNNLGLLLLGAAARGTALVVVGRALGWAFRRKGPAASATLAFATLVSMVGISALGASPLAPVVRRHSGSRRGSRRPIARTSS